MERSLKMMERSTLIRVAEVEVKTMVIEIMRNTKMMTIQMVLSISMGMV
jgi:hypothetical protein